MVAGLRNLTRHTHVGANEKQEEERDAPDLREDTTVGDLMRELITKLNDSQQSQTLTDGNETVLELDIGFDSQFAKGVFLRDEGIDIAAVFLHDPVVEHPLGP